VLEDVEVRLEMLTDSSGIIENAAGKRTLSASIKASLRSLLLRPHNFFFSKPFALIFVSSSHSNIFTNLTNANQKTLYTGTYLSANAIDTASSTLLNKPPPSTTHGTAKFAATSLTNLSLCLWKDAHFTKLFSPVAPRPVPIPTFVLFALRDSMTIAASFNLPPLLAPYIPTTEIMKGVRKESIAQFIAPAAVQVFSTPMHLLGLDFYNRNGTTTLVQRWDVVKRAWAVSCLARLCRIIPAFGVGGVVNAGVRRSFMEKLE
jgi:hypothetical protein